MEMYLPVKYANGEKFCSSGLELKKIQGVVNHWLSCINVKSEEPYNPGDCYNLILDLNRDFHHREFFPMPSMPKRVHASYHYMICRDGQILQLLPETIQAYHAGDSRLNGIFDMNTNTIGIAWLMSHKLGPTDEQYESGAKLISRIMEENGFGTDHVMGHDEVTQHRSTPKKDPGTFTGQFDKPRLLQMIVNPDNKA